MRPRPAPAASILLLLAATTGTVLTASAIVRDGFPITHGPSLFHTAIRIVTVAAALLLWRFSDGWLEKAALASWVVAASSSALYYGLNVSTPALQAVRALTHLLAYATSAVVAARWLLQPPSVTRHRSRLRG